MKINLLLLALLLTLTTSAYSQDLGIFGSGSINTFRTDGSTKYKPLLGYGLGFYLEERFNKSSVLIELNYQRVGGKSEKILDTEYVIKSDFLFSKIILNHYFQDVEEVTNSPFIGFGVYLGPRVHSEEIWRVNGERVVNPEELPEELTVIGFDAGILFNLGYQIDNLSISARTGFGLINIVDVNSSDGKLFQQELFSLRLGVRLK